MAPVNAHKIPNKQKRHEQLLKLKKEKESSKRDARLRRRRTEDKNPKLREERRAKNVPATIDAKRTWDEGDVEEHAGGGLGLSVDVLNPKRRKIDDDVPASLLGDTAGAEGEEAGREEADNDDVDSMLDSDSEHSDAEQDSTTKPTDIPSRAPSEAPSTATDINLTPEALIQRFPTLFDPAAAKEPKVLITTSINATIHWEAELLTSIFPHSEYIRRTAHFHSYKYSVREICKYAAARDYTNVVVISEEAKKPKRLDIVHLPDGPMFHFTISNWVEGKKIPGHGNPTNHYPELILNGFRTPLGLLTAHLFKSLFPQRPEVQGRQVVTLHNQRDYVFFRRHRYVFRDKRGTEKSIQGADGKPMKGVEEIRAGLQELGPRFTLKLRRVDRGIQRASGQEWEWKAHDEKVRTRFSL
ncbi:anticodon-binding protein [Neohortaea acidophila]|uniref:Anticodon-binding protein n=1 Tax=Neohortaea acidophila TaxID=245834 RepID=A0A6A6PXW8_9PEZI|nr:anticodon-binding protein [Neohortaea acidophila]KAF2484606.1 anticodon-binding protein [Neohortaea acidophila]